MRKADRELEEIEKQINERKQNAQRLLGTQDDAICQICQKTKFADGVGHKCFYCQLRSCARCGGRTTSKNKVCKQLFSFLIFLHKVCRLGYFLSEGKLVVVITNSQVTFAANLGLFTVSEKAENYSQDR